MDISEKIKLLADILEVDAEGIDANQMLDSIPTWDSMAALSLIAMLEEHFNRSDIDGNLIKRMVSVQDILNVMEK